MQLGLVNLFFFKAALITAIFFIYAFVKIKKNPDLETKYKGTLACADCPGIATEIIFKKEKLVYNETDVYLERNVTQKISGVYAMEKGYKKNLSAVVYVLDNDKPGHERFYLGFNDTVLLALDG